MKSVAHLVVALALYTAPLAAQQQVSGVNWTVTIVSNMNPIPVGSCGAVSMTLRDSTGKDAPRTPEGWRVSIADFDMTVSSATNVVGVYNGAANWSVCACQGATAERAATVTATYPAKMLAAKSRVVGVEGQWSVPLSIVTSKSTFNPAGCSATATAASTTTTTTTATPIALAPMPMATATLASVAPSATGLGVGAGADEAAAAMAVGGATFRVKHIQGGSGTIQLGLLGSTFTKTGKILYEPIVVDVTPGTPMDAWINEAWLGTPTLRSGSLSQTGARAPLTQLTFANGLVSSTTIPTLDAGSLDAGYLRVTINPGTTAEASGTLGVPAVLPKSWSLGKFALTMPALTTTGVSRIESFVVGAMSTIDPITGAISAKSNFGPSGVQKVFVTLSEATAADWVAWLNASVSGSQPATEKTMTLELRTPADVHLATIHADGVGIVALRTKSGSSDSIRKVQAELYVRRMQLLP